MLQACLYADRHAMDCGASSIRGATPNSRQKFAFLKLSTLASFGRTVLRGRPSDPLNDHLLQDIGLSRADLDAMFL